MPVKDKNPFGASTVEEGKADVGVVDPFERSMVVIKCPICEEKRAEKLDTHNTPTQILRKCKSCGNQWSCGNVGGLIPTPITDEMVQHRPQDTEEDIPDDIRLSGTEDWFD